MQHNSASFQATFFKFGEGQVQFSRAKRSWRADVLEKESCFQSQMQKRIMNLESKIDKILSSMDSLTSAVQNINVKLDCFEKRLNELEGRVNTKHAELTVEVAKKSR